MNRDEKAAVIEEVARQITEAEAIYAVDYRGASVPQAAELRARLREADATFRVVKNTLTERAADRAGVEALKAYLVGPTAMTFVRGDAALAAKALADFRRTSGLLVFKGGWMNGETLSPEQIDSIARLPSRDVLYGRLVGMVASPISGLVNSLSGLIGGLARQLSQIAEQRNVAEGETAEGGSRLAGETSINEPSPAEPESASAAEPDTSAPPEPEAAPAPEPEAAAEPEPEAAAEPQSDLPTDTNEE